MGVHEQSVYCQLVETWRSENLQAKSRDDAFDAVLQGKADALVTTYVSINEYLDHKDVMRGAVDVPVWLSEEKSTLFRVKITQNSLKASIQSFVGS